MTATDWTFDSLRSASNRELEQVMRGGAAPALASLAGWEFRGFNTSPVAELIRSRKFKKGFEEVPGDPRRLMGYNVTVHQNGRHGPWLPVLRRGEPQRGFPFAVLACPAGDRYPDGLLLDYALPGKLPRDPSYLLRDYMVQVSPGNPDLLLGKAYGAVGPLLIFVSYFVAERYNRAL